MLATPKVRVPKQPLVFGSFFTWLHMLYLNGGIDRKYMGVAALVTVTSLLFSPLALLEKLIHGRRIGRIKTDGDKAPVFILGHWRSGTTHLHNLMSQDARLGYLTMYQSLAPGFFIVGRKFIRPLIQWQLPETRPMDNMKIGLDCPQEEEFALGNLCAYSVSQCWHFPRGMLGHFRKWGLFQGVSDRVLCKWKKVYLEVIQKAMYTMGGRRLVVKNPSNTARIKVMLALFPGAKFIHIHRNPYDVYVATLNLHRKVMAGTSFQDIDDAMLRANTLEIYKEMFARFEAERALIPPGDFVELRYEDLDRQPIAELGRIYAALGLGGFAEAEGRFRGYLETQAGFERNAYEMSDATRALVREHWGFAFERWGYE